MLRIILLLLAVIASSQLFATPMTCYRLSVDGKHYSDKDSLCLWSHGGDSEEHTIVLKSMDGEEEKTVATLSYALIYRVRTPNLNMDRFSGANSASPFTALGIRFEGRRDLRTGVEEGTVWIGSTKLNYRSI